MAENDVMNWTPEQVARTIAAYRGQPGASGAFGTPGATGDWGAVKSEQPINVALAPLPAQPQSKTAVRNLLKGMIPAAPITPGSIVPNTAMGAGERLNRTLGEQIAQRMGLVGAVAQPAMDVVGGFYGGAGAVPTAPASVPTSQEGVNTWWNGAGMATGEQGTGAPSATPVAGSTFKQATSTPGGSPMIKYRDPKSGNWTYSDQESAPQGTVGIPVMERGSSGVNFGLTGKTPEQWRAEGAASDWRMAQADRLRGGPDMVNKIQYQTPEDEALATAREAIKTAPNMRAMEIAQQTFQSLQAAKTARETNVATVGARMAEVQRQLIMDQNRMNWETPYRMAEANKLNAEALTSAQLQQLAAAEPDLGKKAAILSRRYAPEPKVTFPGMLQPMVQDEKNPYGVAASSTGVLTRTPINMAIGSKGTTTLAEVLADAKRKGVSGTPIELRRKAETSGWKVTD